MREGPPGTAHHATTSRPRLVRHGDQTPPDPDRTDVVSDLLVSPLPAAPESHAESEWGAVLTLRYPEGTARHPRILGLVEQAIGRFSLVDTQFDGIRVSFGLAATARAEAKADAHRVTDHLLEVLGLNYGAVVRLSIEPDDPAEVQVTRPGLHAVPDLP